MQCCYYIIYFALLFTNVVCRHVPRYADLDEEDQLLFRAVYDTPYDTAHGTAHDSLYDTPSYDHDDEQHVGKFDLLKDGLWAIKAEMKMLKAFNKAFAANLLSTKLKLKGLKKGFLMPVLEHHHYELETKPSHSHQAPAFTPQHYEQSYVPQSQYQAPAQYQAPPLPQNQAAPLPQYQAPAKPQYHVPTQPQYQAPPQYQPQQSAHDPYYGV